MLAVLNRGSVLVLVFMARLENVRIDSRGRIVLPQHFRELLGLKPDDSAYVALDEQNRRILVSPASESNLVYLEILISDAPGSLAKAAAALGKAGVDLVSTESHSTVRGQQAVWRVTGKSAKPLDSLKSALKKAGVAIRLIRKA